MKNIFDGLFKNATALYEYHQPRHIAYRNRQIIQACFASMTQRLDHRSLSLLSKPCQYLALLIQYPSLFLKKHPKHPYDAENADQYVSSKHFTTIFIIFIIFILNKVVLCSKPHTSCVYKFRLK